MQQTNGIGSLSMTQTPIVQQVKINLKRTQGEDFFEANAIDFKNFFTEELDQFYLNILASQLFTYEQTSEIDQWKTNFLNQYIDHLKTDDDQETASLALFLFLENTLLPLKMKHQESAEIDTLICHLKTLLASILPQNEKSVDDFIARNQGYVDEISPERVAAEINAYVQTAELLNAQNADLYALANNCRELIDRSVVSLQAGFGELIEVKEEKVLSMFKQLNEVEKKLDTAIHAHEKNVSELQQAKVKLEEAHAQKLNVCAHLFEITNKVSK